MDAWMNSQSRMLLRSRQISIELLLKIGRCTDIQAG